MLPNELRCLSGLLPGIESTPIPGSLFDFFLEYENLCLFLASSNIGTWESAKRRLTKCQESWLCGANRIRQRQTMSQWPVPLTATDVSSSGGDIFLETPSLDEGMGFCDLKSSKAVLHANLAASSLQHNPTQEAPSCPRRWSASQRLLV